MYNGCWGTLGGGSTEYKNIKRRLENLTRELKGLGSKQLTTREARHFRKKYKETIERIGYYKNKISPKEYRKLWQKIDDFRMSFQHFGFFEMEQPNSSSGQYLPSKEEEGKGYNLRSSTIGNDSALRSSEEHKKSATHESTSLNVEYFAMKTHLENLIASLKQPDSSDMEAHSMQVNTVYQDIMTNKNISKEQQTKLLILCKEYKTCLEEVEQNLSSSTKGNDSDLRRSEEHKKSTSHPSTCSDNEFLDIKTHLENEIANLKQSDTSQMKTHSAQVSEVYKHIVNNKNITEERKHMLLTLWREYKACIDSIEEIDKQKKQMKHDGISGTNCSVTTYGAWNKCSTEESNYKTQNVNSEIGKNDVCTSSTETSQLKFRCTKNKEFYQTPKVHLSDHSSSSKVKYFGKEEGMECETAPIVNQSILQGKTEALDVYGTHLHKTKEDTSSNFPNDSRPLESNKTIKSLDYVRGKQCIVDETNNNSCSGVHQKNTEKQDFNCAKKQSVAERFKKNLPQKKDLDYERKQNYDSRPHPRSHYNNSYLLERKEDGSMLHEIEENTRDRSDNRRTEETKYVDNAKISEEARISIDEMVYHVNRSKNEVLMQDPHYHNNISNNTKCNDQSSNRPPSVGDRGDYNYHREDSGYIKANVYDSGDNRNDCPSQLRDTRKYHSFSKPNENRRSYNENRSVPINLDWNRQYVSEIAEEAKEVEPLQILDVHQYFRDDFDLNSIDSLDFKERVDAIDTYAKTFETKVKAFDEEKYSLEYFVLDEKLMRIIEKLDKIKCQDDQGLTNKKIEVIEYIKQLHLILDQRAKE